MVKTILTKPIDVNDLKQLSPITIVREYMTFNKRKGTIDELKVITSYKVNDAGEVFIKAEHVFNDEKWHKDWQTPKMIADDISYAATHPISEDYETKIKKQTYKITVYSEPEAMKGYYNKKYKNSLEKLENSVRRMF